jgi:hypothetical protein
VKTEIVARTMPRQKSGKSSFDLSEGLELSDANEAPQPADAIDARRKRLGWDMYS